MAEQRSPSGPDAVVLVITTVALSASLLHLQPTGETRVDLVLVICAAIAAVAAGRRAERRWLWISAWCVLVASALFLQWAAALVAGAAAAGLVMTSRRDIERWNVVVAALIVAASARLGSGPFTGSSAIMAQLSLLPMFVGAVVALPGRHRRRTIGAALVAASVVVLIAAGFAVNAWRSFDHVARSDELVQRGLSQLQQGEYEASEATLVEVHDELGAARDLLGGPLARPAQLLPVLSQNRRAALETLGRSIEVVDAARSVSADARSLELVESSVDLGAVERLSSNVDRLVAAVDSFVMVDEAVDMTWVAGPLRSKLDDARTEIADYDDDIEQAARVLALLPDALGTSEPRHYFVGFMTQAEARGIGGFIGNYAVLTADQGRLEMTDFGRSDDLVARTPQGGLQLELDPEFLKRYGAFNFESPRTGVVQPAAWKNVGLSPDFETVAELIATMYPEIDDGHQLDGVSLVDPHVLATLLQYVDPVQAEGVDRPITPRNAVDFILRTQYEIADRDERADLLEVVSLHVANELLSGALPTPSRLIDDLGPLVEEERLLVWSADADLRDVLSDAGLHGDFPDAADPGQFAISFNNAGANKVDAYAATTVQIRRDVDPIWGDVVVVDLDVTNSTPADTLDPFVVKNRVDLPVGASYSYVSAYSSLDLVSLERDSQPIAFESGTELGFNVSSWYAPVLSGDVVSYRLMYLAEGLDQVDLAVHLPPSPTR